MKIVIFAGGVGTRLWPVSRKNSPKQFEKLVGDKSTLQLTVDRVLPMVSPADIFISSGEVYKDLLYDQLPMIPPENIILEPQMRDVGPAVGLVSTILERVAPDEPFVILWSDHLVKNEEYFRKAISVVEEILQKDKNKIVFIGQNSRFASQNLGWIEYGEEQESVHDMNVYAFKRLHYRPDIETAKQYHTSSNHTWNPGYFGTTASFLLSLYQKFNPVMYSRLKEIADAYGTSQFNTVLETIYPSLEKISFDNLILEKIDPSDGLVLSVDLGWSDVGAWESLKEALAQHTDETVTKGKVLVEECRDSLLYNYTNQMVVGIDLEELLVINTGDVLLVCPKNSVPKIKKLVESLTGSENEHLA